MDSGHIAALVFFGPIIVLWWTVVLRLAWTVIRKGLSPW